MESPRERACPSCSAPAESQQRWCLECGHELPGPRRPGLRPAVGIATTLAVLVGAASAGAYTVLQDDKQPPPPPTTVAQEPPATTPSDALPPATAAPPPVTRTPAPDVSSRLPATPAPDAGGSSALVPSGGGTDGTGTGTTTPSTGDAGSVEQTPEDPASTTPPPEPQLALTDIALGAAAVVYAPYAAENADLGDASRTVDGSTRTVWKAPAATDPTASPQIGVYVDLAGKEKIRRLVIRTPTPGMNVEIYGATSGPPTTITEPGWDHLVDRAGIGEQATIALPSRAYRYVLVWITGSPADGARPAIAEISLLSMQPE
jgi:hypothetical protein